MVGMSADKLSDRSRKLRDHVTNHKLKAERANRNKALNSQILLPLASHKTVPPKLPQTLPPMQDQVLKCLSIYRTFFLLNYHW